MNGSREASTPGAGSCLWRTRCWQIDAGFANFQAIETEVPGQVALSRHQHEPAIFCLVVRGRFEENYRRRSRSAGPLDTVFYSPQADHSGVFLEGPVRLFSVGAPEAILDAGRAETRDEPEADFLRMEAGSILLWLYRLLSGEDVPTPRLALAEAMGTLCGFRLHSSPGRRGSPDWVRQAYEQFADNFVDPPDLAAVARDLSVHPCHLVRTFRRQFGFTISDLVRWRRVALSARLLGSSHRTLAQVALEAGFSDQSHFGRAFKKTTGCTPGEFRRLSGIADAGKSEGPPS